MRLLLLDLLFLGALGLCLAAPRENVRWCTISQPEATKCSKWQKNMEKIGGPPISCVRKKSTRQCMDAIVAKKADAMTLDVSLMLDAGLDSYKLRPIAAEVYGTEAQPQTHVYAVAVVKSSSSLQLNQLRGARSCHSGLGEAAGWTIPLGLLRLSLNWKGPPEPLEAAVAKFFSSSCVPGADRTRFPNLCHLCVGTRTKKCAFSSQEPYFGNRGAFNPALCERFGKQSSEFKLFGSPGGQKNLLFKDFTIGFLRVPPKIDAKLYLGSRHITAFQNLKESEFFSQSCAPGSEPTSSLCALCVGDEMGQHKCAANSSERYFGYTGALRCLVEKSGDVAFVKDSTIFQNAEGKNTEAWARDLKLEDYELLCLDGSRKPVTEARSCHLAMAPNHAVVSRSEKANVVEQVLLEQQILFGRTGQKCPGEFCLFQSDTKNLLFNDNTECLARLQGKTTYVKFLGQQYVTATTTLTQCSTSPLLDACAFLEK
ncbi:PREDICTED: lactotransferrin [Dipodomys ordii]|uniref:Lactotransferrin n=1 Tax=Dipodomys ordii TaxID=10020 RepID=A0A1S3GCC9_DIPOR|nr:PREDICTED: lactotransferrin [Dipodomys ordii]